MEQIFTPKRNYKVLVRCMTYNQSKYIEDALNGFAMQRTNFPFVCLVMDDYSTDGEQEVIMSWMERECDMYKAEYVEIGLSNIILVPHKSNVNCSFAFYLLKQNLYGTGKRIPLIEPWRDRCEYEAICEGDDFWIAEGKMQKQVDYLDEHPDFTLIFSNAELIALDGITSDIRVDLIETREYTPSELLEKWIVPTASIIVRREIYKFRIKGLERIVNGDIIIILAAGKMGKIQGLSEKMVAYRIQPSGVTYSEKARLSRYMRMGEHFEAIRDNFNDIVNVHFLARKIAQCYLRRLKYETMFSKKSTCVCKIWNNSKGVFLKNIISIIKYWVC